MYRTRRRLTRLVLVGLAAAVTASGLLATAGPTAEASGPVVAEPMASVTSTAAVPTTRQRIARAAYAELNNDSRNQEVNSSSTSDCNFYTGEVRVKSSACPRGGWGDDEWCADFVKYVWKVSGNVADWGQLGGRAESVRNYGLSHNTWRDADSGYIPQPGDAFTETDQNGNTRPDHTGLVVEYLGDGRFRTIEGNYPDRVKSVIRSVHDSNVWGFAQPVFTEPDAVEHVYKVGSPGVSFNNVFYSYFRRADNRVVRHTKVPNVDWSYPDMAGSVLSTPTSLEYRGDMWVFARGTDNQVNYRINTGAAWSDWRFIPGDISGAPAVAAIDERMFVVVREGNALKYRYYDLDEGWNESGSWLGLGMPSATVRAVTDPVVGQLDGRLAVVVRGSDGYTWLRWVAPGTTPQWTAWTRLSGEITGNPAVATDGDDLHIVVRTPAGEMRYHTFAKGGSSWIHYRGLGSAPGGVFVGSPAAVAFSGLLTVSARNDAGQLLYRTLTDGVWSAWLQLGKPGTALLDSSPVAMQNSATRYLAARANNEELYVRSYREDSGWSAWTHLPSNLAPMP